MRILVARWTIRPQTHKPAGESGHCNLLNQLVGLDRIERSTSPLSGVRSSQLSYRPKNERKRHRAGRLRRYSPWRVFPSIGNGLHSSQDQSLRVMVNSHFAFAELKNKAQHWLTGDSMNRDEVIEKHKDYLFPCVVNYYTEPLVAERGEGGYLWDLKGRR